MKTPYLCSHCIEHEIRVNFSTRTKKEHIKHHTCLQGYKPIIVCAVCTLSWYVLCPQTTWYAWDRAGHSRTVTTKLHPNCQVTETTACQQLSKLQLSQVNSEPYFQAYLYLLQTSEYDKVILISQRCISTRISNVPRWNIFQKFEKFFQNLRGLDKF